MINVVSKKVEMSFSLPNKEIRMIGLENGVGSHFPIAQKGRHFRMKSSKHVCCSLNSLFGPSPEKPVKARERGGHKCGKSHSRALPHRPCVADLVEGGKPGKAPP